MPVLRYGVQFLAPLHKYVFTSKPLNAFIVKDKISGESLPEVSNRKCHDLDRHGFADAIYIVPWV
jgi:hypothetical protein